MKTVGRIIETVMAVSFVFLASGVFMYQKNLTVVLEKTLKLKTEPSFIGGNEMVSFYDNQGDDYGAGSLTYPRNENWKEEGVLDLLVYTVHYPVTNLEHPTWSDYWQLDFTFANLPNPLNGRAGFCFPVIHVYFDFDGSKSGRTDTREARSELVSFAKDSPWDFMLHVDGFSPTGTLYSYDGGYRAPVEVYPDYEDKKILVRLPIEKGGITDVLKQGESRHYVMVGAYDMAARGNFMTIGNRAGMSKGGGAAGRNTPRVYDYLAPSGYTQQELLAVKDGTLYAQLEPVRVSPEAVKNDMVSGKELAALKEAAEQEEKDAERSDDPGISEQDMDNPHRKLLDLINRGNYSEAAAEAEKQLEQNPGDGFVLSYYGSLKAVRGGQAKDLGDKIRAVNEAFIIFDKADKCTAGSDVRLDFLLNRANVAMSVPEEVFVKSLTGAGDFLEAAEIYLNMKEPKKREAADCYYNAGICYEQAGKNEKAQIVYIKALSLDEVSARVKYELALKGIVIP